MVLISFGNVISSKKMNIYKIKTNAHYLYSETSIGTNPKKIDVNDHRLLRLTLVSDLEEKMIKN